MTCKNVLTALVLENSLTVDVDGVETPRPSVGSDTDTVPVLERPDRQQVDGGAHNCEAKHSTSGPQLAIGSHKIFMVLCAALSLRDHSQTRKKLGFLKLKL